MFSSIHCLLSCVILLLYSSKTCIGDIPGPSLALYAEGSPEYAAVLVRRVGDNMKLICELRGQPAPRYVWNYIPEDNTTTRSPYKVTDTATSSTLSKNGLQTADSGQYMCSAPPFSVTKYILVQPPGPKYCGRGTFWCGQRCMAAMYVCDGRRDCTLGEDEAAHMCGVDVCSRVDKLNCSTGRCISEWACCRSAGPLCQQPSCCLEHPRFATLEGFPEVEYPPLQDDRHAPDDYGFIQSTIYTVTACALIFMIAVVLLVSAICKMHMKRAALRSYAHAERATSRHYSVQYAQTHRFPPCYEASRLLEQERSAPAADAHSSPLRQSLQCSPTECPQAAGEAPAAEAGLARLSSIFSTRYRQVPTQCDVELTRVRPASPSGSPARAPLAAYRSPAHCELDAAEPFAGAAGAARELNAPAPPRRLTLQLGRFQLSIPRFGRRDAERRPDTPDVAEIDIEELDFVRTAAGDTYTLNGRTIRLLGADFENYPAPPDGSRPPPYCEAMRCKFLGPPPEYLSRERLDARADEDARGNVEMPPGYHELARDGIAGIAVAPSNGNGTPDADTLDNLANDSSGAQSNGNPVITVTDTDGCCNSTGINSIIDNLPAIDSDVNANDILLNDAVNCN